MASSKPANSRALMPFSLLSKKSKTSFQKMRITSVHTADESTTVRQLHHKQAEEGPMRRRAICKVDSVCDLDLATALVFLLLLLLVEEHGERSVEALALENVGQLQSGHPDEVVGRRLALLVAVARGESALPRHSLRGKRGGWPDLVPVPDVEGEEIVLFLLRKQT